MSSSPSPQDYKHDPRYRRYASAIDKNLQTFEAISEWPDFISFLSRLIKTISQFPQYPNLPKKLLVSKRLAQCLNPALPGGVHQKTLEVYDLIFKKPEALAQDLPIYALGLFPFFEHAKTMTRSEVLNIVDKHLLPIGPNLLPSLQSLLLALLPGLEEDTSEFFPSMVNIMNKIRDAVDARYFYKIIWTSLLISHRHRLAIVNYILKVLPTKLVSQDDMKIVFNPSQLQLIAAALSAALRDKNSLVVRGVFDIMMVHFPLSDDYLSIDIFQNIMVQALAIVMRRDMSLTRRFYSWILGGSQDKIFEISPKALSITLSALKTMLLSLEEKDLRPFKILVFLMDKPSISKPIVNGILFDCIVALSNLISEKPEACAKILSTANSFFDIVDLNTAWYILCCKIHESLLSNGDSDNFMPFCFVIRNLSLCDEESLAIQMPLFQLVLLDGTKRVFNRENLDLAKLFAIIYNALSICKLSFQKINFDASLNGGMEASAPTEVAGTNSIISSILASSESFASVSLGKPQFFKMNIELLMDIGNSLLNLLTDNMPSLQKIELTRVLLSVFVLLEGVLSVEKNIKIHEVELKTWYLSLSKISLHVITIPLQYWETAVSKIDLLELLLAIVDHLINLQELCASTGLIDSTFLQSLMPKMWNEISPLTLSDSVNIIYRLLACSPSVVDQFIARQLLSSTISSRVSNIKRFSSLWQHLILRDGFYYGGLSKCLFAMIDMTNDKSLELQKEATNWFMYALEKPAVIMDIFLVMLLESLVAIEEESPEDLTVFAKPFDVGQVEYSLKNILTLIFIEERTLSAFISSRVANPSLIRLADTNIPIRFRPKSIQTEYSYSSILYSLMLSFSCSEVSASLDVQSQYTIYSIQNHSLNILKVLINNITLGTEELIFIRKSIMSRLQYYIEKKMFTMASKFLELFQICLTKIASLKTDSVSSDLFFGLEDVELLCLSALATGDNCYVIREWLNFVLAVSAIQTESFEEFFLGMIKAFLGRLSKCMQPSKNTSAYETSQAFICQLLIGIFQTIQASFTATNSSLKNLTTPTKQPSASLKSVFSTSVGDKTSFGSSESKSLSTVIKFLPRAFLELEKLQSALISSSSFDHYKKSRQIIMDYISEMYLRQPDVILWAFIETWALGHEEEMNCKQFTFLNVDSGPLAKDFVKNASMLYKNLKDGTRPEFLRLNIETFINFLQDCSLSIQTEGLLLEFWLLASVIIRDILINSVKMRATAAPTLRLYLALYNKLLVLGIHDQKKIVKEYLDPFLRLCELNIGLASKLNDVSCWVDYPHNLRMTSCRLPSIDVKSEENYYQYTRDKIALKSLFTIYNQLLPILSTISIEQEKLLPLISQIVTQLISPNLRGSHKRHFVGIFGLEALTRLSEPPLSNLEMHLTLLRAVLKAEPEKFHEVINKIPASSSATIFLSKEIENLNRAMSIRRLALTVYCSNPEIIKQSLPILQEKLVDILKLAVGIGTAEVYFLVRILILVMPEDNLLTLWPIIITDLLQLFQSVLRFSPVAISKELLVALYQACKLLDTMLLLASGTINLYAWAFVSDASLNPNDQGTSVALFDRICTKFEISETILTEADHETCLNRRPILTTKTISAFNDLAKFFLLAKCHLKHENIVNSPPAISMIHEIVKQDFIDE